MPFTTLVTAEELEAHLADPEWTVVDCRFSLADPERGRRDYLKSHLPGAHYLHLDEDLSAPIVPGLTGRHPLPEPMGLARRFAGYGMGSERQIVAYDDAGGAFAGRCWWLLKWLGHETVAVLDGGWQGWIQDQRPVSDRVAPLPHGVFHATPRPDMTTTMDEIRKRSGTPGFHLIDARARERYTGETEPIDPVAGHIPGALNLPYEGNLTPEGRFRSPAELAALFSSCVGDAGVENTVCYCGSGVTAAHLVLAAEIAGLGRPKIYPGSWSEWITRPENPIATGATPR